MNEVDLFELERDEEVVLEKLVDSLVLGRNLHFDRIVKGSPVK